MANAKNRCHLIVGTLQDNNEIPSIDNLIISAEYYRTNIHRKLGDTIMVNGDRKVIIILGYDKKSIIEEINKYIKMQNEYISIQKNYYRSPVGKNQLRELEGVLQDLGITIKNQTD